MDSERVLVVISGLPGSNTWRVASADAGVRLAFVLLTLDDEAEHRRRLDGRLRGLAHVPEPTWSQVRARAATYPHVSPDLPYRPRSETVESAPVDSLWAACSWLESNT